MLGLYGMLEFKLCCEILLLDMAHRVVSYVERCGVSSAEYHVHLVGVNTLYTCREYCNVHNWQNGTRCRDGVKVLRSFPSSLVDF